MPYHVAKSGKCAASKPWAVIKDSDGKVMGCHPTKAKAQAQMAALYSQETKAAAEPAQMVMPPLATIPEVDLVATGTWALSTGTATFTTDDLASAVEAAQCPAVGNPIIKLGHTDPRFNATDEDEAGQDGDGQPAIGRVTNMTLASGGQKITGDLAGMPGWLGVISGSAYPQRSIEGSWGFTCQIGHVHPFVITAVALLGVAGPGVGVLEDLADVAALYGLSAVAASGQPAVSWRLDLAAGGTMPEPVLAAGVTVDDVRRAYYDDASDVPYSYWITEMQLSPPQLIVCDDKTAKTYRVPVKISGTTVTFGDAVEVSVEYQDVAAGLAAARAAGLAPAPLAAWASAEAGRDEVVYAWSGSTQVKNLGTDPTAAQLRALFALPGASKSESKLPHHTVSADGKVGAADDGGCSAAIAAINGGRGGLKGVSAADLKKAYNHLAKHLRDDGKEPPEYTGPAASAADPEVDAARHGSYTGTHSHEHGAYGAQGGDQTHTHSHTHNGDAVHSHAHAGAGPTTEGDSEMELTDEQKAALRASLGLAEDAELTAEELVAGAAKLADAAKAPPAGAVAGRLGPDQMIIDKDAWDAQQARLTKLEAAGKKHERAQRDDVIRAAIKAGKFSAASKERYERAWDKDPDNAREIIASLRPNVVPVDDIGQAGGDPDEDQLDAEYRSLFPPGAPAQS